MDEDLISVESSYQERIAITHLSMEPALQGQSARFNFEGHLIEIELPTLPSENQRHPGSLIALAEADVWNKDGEIINVHIYSVLLSILGLRFEIPKAAASFEHIDATLYTSEQTQTLDAQSDALYFLAHRAMDYFLRILRWKTGFGLTTLNPQIERGPSFGGRLINLAHGGSFYSPLVNRTVIAPKRYRLTPADWHEITASLAAEQAPPLSNEFLTSGQQRIESGDLSAAVLDLAIAAELVIRQAIDKQLPTESPRWTRETIVRLNISNIIDKWDDYGLPAARKTEWFPLLKELVRRRNRLMHRGATEEIDSTFCENATKAVNKLIGALP